MSAPVYFITGTDTDVGKTVASAWAMLHLGADYWKPVQSGLEAETDTQVIKRLLNQQQQEKTEANEPELHEVTFHPSTYELPEPLSPHESARRAGVEIKLDAFTLPETERPLIIEGAGGLMVPVNDTHFVIDLIAKLGTPVILVTRSGLGTINHTLLSLKALADHQIPVKGLIINGPLTSHNRSALEEFGKQPILAEIPFMDDITAEALYSIKPEHPL